MDDRITQITLDALKQGIAEPDEQRLYKSGKLPGLFAGRTNANGEAAQWAIGQGLVEITRTETKGKALVEWVRLTPRGVDFVVSHESPARAMDDLRAALEATHDGLPAWIVELRGQLQALSDKMASELAAMGGRLEALSQRVDEALKRAKAAAPRVPEGAAGTIPWAQDVLDSLEKRRAGGLSGACPLPEMYAAIRGKQSDLSVPDFQSGLRQLHARGLVRLLPFEGAGALPEPEHALLEGATVIYFVAQ